MSVHAAGVIGSGIGSGNACKAKFRSLTKNFSGCSSFCLNFKFSNLSWCSSLSLGLQKWFLRACKVKSTSALVAASRLWKNCSESFKCNLR